MGRNKLKTTEKAVKISITIRPELHEEILARVKYGKKKKSRIISDDLIWYSEIMNIVGISMEGRFLIQEIEALCSVFEKIKTEPGQVSLLAKRLVSVFQNKALHKTGIFTFTELNNIETIFKVSIRNIHRKLSKMSHTENIWLYEKLTQANAKNWITDRKQLALTFRCTGENI